MVPPRPSHACGPHMLSFFNGSRKRFVCSANVRVQFSNNRRMKYETLCRRGRTWWKWMLIRTMAADAGSPDAFAHFPQDLLYSPRAFDLSTWGCITLLLGSLTRSQPSAAIIGATTDEYVQRLQQQQAPAHKRQRQRQLQRHCAHFCFRVEGAIVCFYSTVHDQGEMVSGAMPRPTHQAQSLILPRATSLGISSYQHGQPIMKTPALRYLQWQAPLTDRFPMTANAQETQLLHCIFCRRGHACIRITVNVSVDC